FSCSARLQLARAETSVTDGAVGAGLRSLLRSCFQSAHALLATLFHFAGDSCAFRRAQPHRFQSLTYPAANKALNGLTALIGVRTVQAVGNGPVQSGAKGIDRRLQSINTLALAI